MLIDLFGEAIKDKFNDWSNIILTRCLRGLNFVL